MVYDRRTRIIVDTIDLNGHRYDYGNYSPTAGIWHGVRRPNGIFDWQLAFKPTP